MATTLNSSGVKFPNNTCQLSQGQVSGGMFQCYNTCLICNGPHRVQAHCGRCGTWTAPTCASVINFEVWSGGGSGAGHCCFSCRCDIAACGAYSGYYGTKTIRRIDGQFVPGCSYSYCVGAGGNGTTNSGCGCFNACCNAPRGCMTYVSGAGLCCTCMTGGRGGYNLYCSCGCNHQSNRTDGMCNNGLCIGCKWDFVDLGTESRFYKAHYGCDCATRMTTTSTSFGIHNGTEYNIESSRTHCGCTNCCKGMRQISGAGQNNLKAYCGNIICYCLGTPGKPGLVRINWS